MEDEMSKSPQDKKKKEKKVNKARKPVAKKKAAPAGTTLFMDREIIEETLKVARDFVEKKLTMPVLSHVLLEAGKTKCSVFATDIETAWRRRIHSEGGPVKRCVPLNLLLSEIHALGPEIAGVELTFTDNAVSVNGRCEIFTLHADEFPTFPMFDGETVEVDGLPEKLKRVVVASGDSDTRYTLNSVLLDLGAGHMVGTDGHRLHIEDIAAVKDGGKLIVPRKAALMSAKHSAAASIRFNEKFITFEVAGGEMLSRLIEGTYPSYENIVPRENPVTVTFSGPDFLQVLEGALPVTPAKAVKLTINGQIVVESQSHDTGSYRWQVPCDATGKGNKNFVFGVNAGYLRDALKAFPGEDDVVQMRLKDTLSPCLINGKAVVMPMRI
jgi:DNA polymerase-3 subunit beta